jgi:hemerythrin-like domain-containing protein
MKPAPEAASPPDPVLIRAMVRYIQEFPLALHHPKEEEYLFRKLRERTSTVNPELDELERQHDRDRRMVAELAALAERYVAGALPAADLEQAVAAYTHFIWEHMGREEGVVLPEAQRYLTDEDWREINAAFSENRDPRFGGETDTEFRRLFSRIVNLTRTDGGARARTARSLNK